MASPAAASTPPVPSVRNNRSVLARLRARRVVRHRLGVPRTARHAVGWDLLAGACTGAYMGMTFPFVTRIARGELHASETAIALMAAAPFIGNLLSPLWAQRMEGRAKMPFVIGSWLAARSLLLLMPLAVSPLLFVVLMGGLQFIGTISTPAYTSLMRDIYPDRARGRLMSYVRVGAQSAMFVSTLTAGRLLDHHIGYRILFPCAGLLGFCGAYAFSRVLGRTSNPAPPPGPVLVDDPGPQRGMDRRAFVTQTLSILRHNVGYRWFAASVTVYGFANLAMVPLYQLFQVDVLKISSTQIANLANCASLSAIAGSLFWGRFMDRWGAPRAVFLSICCVALIPLVYLTARSVVWLALASAFSGFGFAGIELGYMASILLYAERGREAQYQSLHSLLLGVRGVLAPLVSVGLLRAIGYSPMFVVGAVLMLLGAALQLLSVRAAAPTRYGAGAPM